MSRWFALATTVVSPRPYIASSRSCHLLVEWAFRLFVM